METGTPVIDPVPSTSHVARAFKSMANIAGDIHCEI